MKTTPSVRVFRNMALGAAFGLIAPIACKKLSEVDVPVTNPNPPAGPLPSPQPTGSVTIGLPSPSPGSSPSPSPSATVATTSSPTPSPVGSATPGSASCNLAPLPEGSPCREESASFQAQVEAAQAEVARLRPDFFDGGRVRSEDAYVQEVARVLRTRGLCAAQGGPKDEVAVKITNEWNDQYDIVLSSGQPWTSYQVTCRPARF
jgi:hypothetical protein